MPSERPQDQPLSPPDAALPPGPAPRLLITPESKDWGEIATGVSWWHVFNIGNLGDEPLDFSSATLVGLDDFTIQIDGVELLDAPELLLDPDQDGTPGLSPGTSFEVRLYFEPQRSGLYEGFLRLVSNDLRQPILDVPVSGVGVASPPCALVDPSVADFPDTVSGLDNTIEVVVRNCDEGPLEITDLVIEGDAYGLGVVGRLPIRIPAPADSSDQPGAVIPVRFRPQEEGRAQGTLRVVTDNPDFPERLVPLQGTGTENLCPTAAVAQSRLRRPVGSTVELDSSPSSDPEEGRLDYIWTIIERPEGSRAQVRESFRAGQGFIADREETANAVLIPDVVGRYTLSLDVVDPTGNRAADCDGPALLEVEAQPVADGLTAVLTWSSEADADPTDSEGPDLDLHMRRPGGLLWFDTETDCYPGALSPDWGVPGRLEDNPALVVGNHNDGGPEIIRLEVPESTGGAAFRVAAHYFRAQSGGVDYGPAMARLQLYTAQGLIWDSDPLGVSRPLLDLNHFWEIVDISWPNASVQIVDRYFDQRP